MAYDGVIKSPLISSIKLPLLVLFGIGSSAMIVLLVVKNMSFCKAALSGEGGNLFWGSSSGKMMQRF